MDCNRKKQLDEVLAEFKAQEEIVKARYLEEDNGDPWRWNYYILHGRYNASYFYLHFALKQYKNLTDPKEQHKQLSKIFLHAGFAKLRLDALETFIYSHQFTKKRQQNHYYNQFEKEQQETEALLNTFKGFVLEYEQNTNTDTHILECLNSRDNSFLSKIVNNQAWLNHCQVLLEKEQKEIQK